MLEIDEEECKEQKCLIKHSYIDFKSQILNEKI